MLGKMRSAIINSATGEIIFDTKDEEARIGAHHFLTEILYTMIITSQSSQQIGFTWPHRLEVRSPDTTSTSRQALKHSKRLTGSPGERTGVVAIKVARKLRPLH
jgi:hypothetical protein